MSAPMFRFGPAVPRYRSASEGMAESEVIDELQRIEKHIRKLWDAGVPGVALTGLRKKLSAAAGISYMVLGKKERRLVGKQLREFCGATDVNTGDMLTGVHHR